MKQSTKNNRGLLNKNNFKCQEKEKEHWLRNLSMNEAISLEEKLLSSSLAWELRKNFSEDRPVCLKMLLNKKCHRKEKI